MTYEEIIQSIALREKTSFEAIENEIKKALASANFDCSPKDFIMYASKNIAKTIYSR